MKSPATRPRANAARESVVLYRRPMDGWCAREPLLPPRRAAAWGAARATACVAPITACCSTPRPMHRNPGTGHHSGARLRAQLPRGGAGRTDVDLDGRSGQGRPRKIIRFAWHTDKPGARSAPISLSAPYTLIVDNLLDFSHLTYVHSTTIGTPSTASTLAQVEPIEGGLKITRRYYKTRIQANRASIATFHGPPTDGRSTNGSRHRLYGCTPARHRPPPAHMRGTSCPRRCSTGIARCRRRKRQPAPTTGSPMPRTSRRDL